jgi:hypothetical protein
MHKYNKKTEQTHRKKYNNKGKGKMGELRRATSKRMARMTVETGFGCL